MEISLRGKRALVTGAGRGIGRNIVKALVHCGAEVVVFEINEADLESLKEEIPSIHAICIDITDTERVREVIQDLDEVHLVVNNAAVCFPESFLEISPESFNKTYDTNTKAPLFVAQAVARKMVASGIPGSIVNISSDLSQRPHPHLGVYGTSKAALNQLSRVMALELGPHKIRVNTVQPAMTLTGISGMLSKPENKAACDKIIEGIPLGRHVDIEEVVNAVLFLLSDQAAMIHGAGLLVDGGRSV